MPATNKPQAPGSILSEHIATRLSSSDPTVKILWGGPDRPWFDWQRRALTSICDEIGLLGGKGSGKSTLMRGWMVTGNPHLPDFDSKGNPILVNQSYVYHPSYRGLILRRNQEDLADFLDRAAEMWKPFGGDYVDGRFRFPSGAVIDAGHMKDRNAWQKYIGIEYQRIAIDEAGLIPEFESYEELRSCMRSPYPELRCQVMLASNAGGPGTCVRQGEVLTPNGWVDIWNMRVGDPVYTVNPNGEMVQTIVDQVNQYSYDGDLAITEQRGFFMECTPNHSVAYRPRSINPRRTFELRRFDELPNQAWILRSVGWQGTPIGDFYLDPIPPSKHGRGNYKGKQPLHLSASKYLTLLGWFLSEGFTIDAARTRKLFGIVQGKSPHKQELRSFLSSCGFRVEYPKSGEQAIIHGEEWWRHFRIFGEAFRKHVPAHIKSCPVDQLRILLRALMRGDGSWGRQGSSRGYIRSPWEKSGVYYTSSKQLADDVAEICLKLGYAVYVSSRLRDPMVYGDRVISPTGLSYEVFFKTLPTSCTEIMTGNRSYRMKSRGIRPRGSDTKYRHFTGKVCCLGIRDTHTFIIRQRGCVWISGNSWLIKRFMSARDENGVVIPHDTPIVEQYTHPFTHRRSTRTRIWMFSTIQDNPIYRDSSYAITLISNEDLKKRAAYFEGRWDMLFGSYFGDLFRPDGPLVYNNEPENACHTIHVDKKSGQYPVKLTPWWNRSIGFDWGYAHEAAILWGARSPDKRIYVYREMVASQTSPERLGYELALASREELEALPHHSMTLYLSHDAFHNRTGDRSIAEIVALGISRVLGKDSVHLPDILAQRIRDAYSLNSDNPAVREERDLALEQLRTQRRLGITIRRSVKMDTIGWQHCRETLKWEILRFNSEFDINLFYRILAEDGPKKADLYAQSFRQVKREPLPRLQIFYEACPRLIESIPKVQHKEGTEEVDEAHFKGRDVVDAWGYLVLGMRDERPEEPFEEYREKEIATVLKQDPNITTQGLIWVNKALEAEWKKKQIGTFTPYTPPRKSRLRRLIAQGKIKRD